MILHIAPDYINKPLYQHLFEAIHSQDTACEQYVYACDNASHDTQDMPDNVHIVNRSFSALERFLYFPKQRYLLRDIEANVPIRDFRLIHAHTLFSSGYLAYKLHKKYGIPYIVAVRNTDVNVFFKRMPHLRSIGRKIAAHAQKIIFISPAYKEQVIGTFLPHYLSEKAVVLPNGIDRMFIQDHTPHPADADSIKLIYVGRIEKDKNIHTLIKVVDSIAEQGKPVKLCMVGAIVDERFKSLIEARNYIEWHDQCPKEEVLRYLRQNDIFVMPSYHETFGLVYAEAMSQGLPVIYTRGQGFDGFFKDGIVGYAVPANDVQYIVNKVMEIRCDYTAMSQRCQHAACQFDWNIIAQTYRIIYENSTHGIS